MTTQALAARLRSTNHDYMAGEAALVVAGRAQDADDARVLLEALGIERASYRWDAARVAFVVMERYRNGVEFSVNSLYPWVPLRAQRLVARAVTWLRDEDLVRQTGRTVLSASPGARGRKIPCWRLTPAGERLSRGLSPVYGMDPELLDLN